MAGDALHPMTPDLGQGGCSALEDAVVLARHVGDSVSGCRNPRRKICPGEVRGGEEMEGGDLDNGIVSVRLGATRRVEPIDQVPEGCSVL